MLVPSKRAALLYNRQKMQLQDLHRTSHVHDNGLQQPGLYRVVKNSLCIPRLYIGVSFYTSASTILTQTLGRGVKCCSKVAKLHLLHNG